MEGKRLWLLRSETGWMEGFVKDGLGLEEFQVLRLESIRKLLAMVVIAGCFLEAGLV